MKAKNPKLSQTERIMGEIKRLTWNGNGTYDLGKTSVRAVRIAAKASHPATHAVLKDLRAKSKAGKLHFDAPVHIAAPLLGESGVDASTNATASSTAEATVTHTDRATDRSDTHVPASVVGAPIRDTRPADAVERAIARQGQLLASLVATVADLHERVVNPLSEPPSKLQPKRITVQPSPKPPHAVRPPAPDATGPETDRKRLGRAVEVILRERGPLSGPKIFKALSDAVQRPFRERQIQELLRWSKANLGNLDQLKDGRWRLPDQPDPVVHRRPTKDSMTRRIRFAALAVKEIRKNGRPLGATEIWDAGSRQKPLGFVRNHSFHVLRLAKHPDLLKLPDGSWALREWKEIPPRRPGYHSRVRGDYYGNLAKEVWEILRTNGGAMTSFEIRKKLSNNMAHKVQNRGMIDVLFHARRELPQLIYGEDRRWRIEGMQEQEDRKVARADELARAVMEILREHKTPMKSACIRKLIPTDLRAAYPSILRPLRILQSRYPEFVEIEKKTWTLMDAHADPNS